MFYYFKILHLFVCVIGQAHAIGPTCTGACHRPHVETRGPPMGVSSLPSTVQALEVELKLGWQRLYPPGIPWHHTGSVPSTTLSCDSFSTRAVK